MNIRTIVRIIGVLALSIIGGVVILNYFIYSRVEHVEQKRKLIEDALKVTNEQRAVSINYFLFHKLQSITEWQVLQDATVTFLQSNLFNTLEEDAILEDMREYNIEKNKAFTRLITLSQEKAKQNNISIKKTLESELISKTITLGNSIIDGAVQLGEINYQERISIAQLNSLITIASGFLLVALIFISLVIIEFRVVRPISKLHNGMKVIANGDLDYRLKITSSDELRLTALSFNKMADQLQKAFFDLENEISARKVRQKELLRANQMLAHQKNDLKQFAFIAAHDLQTPVRHLISYIDLLSRKSLAQFNEAEKQWMNHIVKAAYHMRSLIQDLLVYSLIGTHEEPLTSFPMKESIQVAIQELAPEIKQTQAIIEIDQLPTVVAYRSQISELFKQLISNAIKFHKKNVSPIIKISEEFTQAPKGFWCFSIEDNGLGIDSKYFEKIFDLFQRLYPSDEFPGTGMGLSMCKKIVGLHFGKIWVKSELGKYSKFFFTLAKQ